MLLTQLSFLHSSKLCFSNSFPSATTSIAHLFLLDRSPFVFLYYPHNYLASLSSHLASLIRSSKGTLTRSAIHGCSWDSTTLSLACLAHPGLSHLITQFLLKLYMWEPIKMQALVWHLSKPLKSKCRFTNFIILRFGDASLKLCTVFIH